MDIRWGLLVTAGSGVVDVDADLDADTSLEVVPAFLVENVVFGFVEPLLTKVVGTIAVAVGGTYNSVPVRVAKY